MSRDITLKMENNAETESDNSSASINDETNAAPSNPLSKPNRPTFEVMVKAAIKELDEPKGSSLHAIKKYIAANYMVDITKSSMYIKNYVKKAIIKGDLIQKKGNGINGSFKLPKEIQKRSKTKVVPKLSAALKVSVSKKDGKVNGKDEQSKKEKNNKITTAKKTGTMKPKVTKMSKTKTSKEPKTKDAGTKSDMEPKTKTKKGEKIKASKKPEEKKTKVAKETRKKPANTFKLNTSVEAIRKSLGAAKKASRNRATRKQKD